MRKERALLIGVDEFVTKADTTPCSENNVSAMQEVFLSSREPLEKLVIPSAPVVSLEALRLLIWETFQEAETEDVSYFYVSTHGEYEPGSGEEPAFLLSDGKLEIRITPTELEAAFEGVLGKKVIILDACNSGAFIGKGDPYWEGSVPFLGEDFKVLVSSGALEESWYWNTEEKEGPSIPGAAYGTAGANSAQGAFYFTQALLQSLSPRYGFPADGNRDGRVTLRELYGYLLENHAVSIPQVYPQEEDFVFFRYDLQDKTVQGANRSPILDVTFSGSMLDRENNSVTLEYIATRPVRVGYQIVYFQDGKWCFDEAKIIFDEVERFTVFGDQLGAVSAGRKMRTLMLDLEDMDAYGYMLVQLVSIDQGRVRIHGGQVFCVPPTEGDLQLAVEVGESYQLDSWQELSVFVKHAYPCALSVAVVNEKEEVVKRLAHRQSTRPSIADPAGSLFYWNGTDREGELVPPGEYRIRVSGDMQAAVFSAMSEPILVQ